MRPLLPRGLLRMTAARERDVLARELAALALEVTPALRAELVLLEDRDEGIVARSLASAERRYAMGEASLVSSIEAREVQETPLADRPALALCLAGGEPVIGCEAGAPAVFPLRVHASVAGMLVLQCARPPASDVVESARRLAAVCANHLALLEESQRDALTGLLNRKTFMRHFAASPRPREGIRLDAPADRWLAVADIDHFKAVNDRHGHLIGDEVLLGVARIMRRSLRGSDQVFRFGGEEFVILLEDVPGPAIGAILERLRSRVAEAAFNLVGGVTISIGASRMAPEEGPDAAIYRADKALYYAKDHGRNRVDLFEALRAADAVPPPPSAGAVELFEAA